MTKKDPNQSYLFEFDEKGTMEVSEQILNSYNSGFIDEGTAQSGSEQYYAGTGPSDDTNYQGTEGANHL